MRVGVWDLETTDLVGDFGRLICAVIYDTKSRKYTTFRNDEFAGPDNMQDDRELVVAVRDALETYHITVGWYSKGFDIPFLNTRLIYHGERPLARHLHLDSIWVCKGWRGLKARNGRLATIAEFFDLKDRKPGVDACVWIDARQGDVKAINEVVDRCKADVKITWQITERLMNAGLVKNIQSYP